MVEILTILIIGLITSLAVNIALLTIIFMNWINKELK